MNAPRFLPALVFICPVLFLSCANQIGPGGGPVDTVPPKIIGTYPAPYTLHFNDRKIELEFDKYVDPRSVEESIFISPYVGDLDFDWSGKDVEVTFSEKLKPNKTYVVNVGTDVVDLNNRNRMAQAFALAFSTGDDIDHGAIRGRVYAAKPADKTEGVMIFAYQLAGMEPDTLDPRTLKPDYITQTGKNGQFFLEHLGFGAYRVFAVRDEFRNLLYDPEADDFGVPSRPLNLTPADTMEDHVLMQLGKEDTTAPRLVKVEARDVHHVTVEFSESIDTSSAVFPAMTIGDTLSLGPLKTYSIFPNLPKLSSFTVVTDLQDSTTMYRLTVQNARDLVGLPISVSAAVLDFGGSAIVDSSAPRLVSASIQDSARGVALEPSMQFRFSDALNRGSFAHAITVSDSSGNPVSAPSTWLDDAVVGIRFPDRLVSKCWYKISFVLHGGTDWSGRTFRDSVRVFHFETLDVDALSSIEGTVVDADTSDREGNILVAADAADATEVRTVSTIARHDGTFVIPEIEEGKYVIHAFRDRNRNGVYDVGRPFPYVPSERFGYGSDTLKVRARWPLEGVRIELR
ncbi:MAG TPA: Ig-like domain-containing protein [Bacteroidota bacterium]|nr:Ig-like domain-containing protein [Bacteroidota bacterium]